MNEERRRIRQMRGASAAWRRWGPYLAEREWGTVREDYSPDGTVWRYFPHDHARSRAYRWGEDGIAGFSDDRQHLCFSLALWNGNDPILKERLFGLTGKEGNHGEDVKECYYYLDNTPTHSYMRMLYKYPQAAFPYELLVRENGRRGWLDPELELVDTGIFDEDRYFDVFVEFAKRAPDDILVRISAHNRGPDPAVLHLIPQLTFRNTWSWTEGAARPALTSPAPGRLHARHPGLGTYRMYGDGQPDVLLTDNETNAPRLFGVRPGAGPGRVGYKDAFHEYVVEGEASAVRSGGDATKAGLHYTAEVAAGSVHRVRLRLSQKPLEVPFRSFSKTIDDRRRECRAFYDELLGEGLSEDEHRVARQAYAGLLWTKQWYGWKVDTWLDGDPAQPAPPRARLTGRNADWRHLDNGDILSMPDAWEYPWYAAWDLAFQCVSLAVLDADFAKAQLLLLTTDRYMHPDGRLPAYEWALGDANPPVHAWASWRVYEMDRARGEPDVAFLEQVFDRLHANFSWWVSRKDADGNNLFEGGFLGLDNIGVFDRSEALPGGRRLEQADGTSWMAMFCLSMMRIAVELGLRDPAYHDDAARFFEHFLHIAAAMADIGGTGIDLWDEEDQFFYDVLHVPGQGAQGTIPLAVRSIVGLSPLFAVEVLDGDLVAGAPRLREQLEASLARNPALSSLVSRWHEPGVGDCRLLSLLRTHRMKRLLERLLDETEFLSEFGVRAMSRWHEEHPYALQLDGATRTVGYEPAESRSGLFGGNSNWRGPIWFPVNYLLIESLRKFHRYYGDGLRVECPTGSGNRITLSAVADELSRRLIRIFATEGGGRRPVFGEARKLQEDPHFRDNLLFYECFHGDTGRGVGASHQTGWTALVAELLRARS